MCSADAYNLSIDISNIYKQSINVLEGLSKDTSRPSNALMASIELDLLELAYNLPDEKNCIELLIKTLETCRSGSNLIGFPFEKFYNLFLCTRQKKITH